MNLGARPLRSDDELDHATEIVNSLIDRDELTEDEQEYLDVLSDQIEAYESAHHPMSPVCGADMLRFLIESKGVTPAEVAESTNLAESTIGEVLDGKRDLEREQAEVLARYFHVRAGDILC